MPYKKHRVLVAECMQEISSFNPLQSGYDNFHIERGSEMLAQEGLNTALGGAFAVFREKGLEPVLAIGARAGSAGLLSAAGWKKLSAEVLQAVAMQSAAGIDGVYFSMHGAMAADGELDPEGYLLSETRRIVGPDVPIVISLDLHGILTDRMLQHSDAVVAYHTYPHVDFFQTGARAAALLMKVLTRGVRPVTARVKIPALVRGDELITETGAIRECIQLAQQIEASDAGLSAGVMWGNPFTDVPELRTNSFVVMDGDETAARAQAIELANRFWRHHEKMQVPLASLADSVRLAGEVRSGTVVLMDAADATSSGASGDSNAILRELLRRQYRGRVLAPIVDPAAVRQAFAAGVGATIRTTVGGAFDPARFQPLAIEAQVRLLSDGKFRSESFGWPWDSGPTAVLQSDNVTLVVGTRPVSLFDRSWFYAHGQDPRQFDVVVVKSPHCEPHMFASWCAKRINVDAPGSTSANLRSLGHRRCARPIFPLDDAVDFHPVVQVFRRK